MSEFRPGPALLAAVLRVALTGTVAPFVLRPAGRMRTADLEVPRLGAYVHIPFCATLCPFCPYNRVALGDGSALPAYLDAVTLEVGATLGGRRRRFESVYFGGGSPALAGRGISLIIAEIRRHAEIRGGIGLELHPRDVTPESVFALRDAGVTMVSVGVQSFQPSSLDALGRPGDPAESRRALGLVNKAGFAAVDTDLIFGIPGQSEDDLARDFALAAELGATQVSTYPFIDFSYAANRFRPLSGRRKRKLLHALPRIAAAHGFERGSVWTFRRAATPAYSSVTRDNFVGFGASAVTLLGDRLAVNRFGVEDYISAVRAGRRPAAYTLRFNPRTRRVYWLFWACYRMALESERYRALFGTRLRREFGGALWLAEALGCVARAPGGYALTRRGAYWYHEVEQVYTRRYIDKTWRAAMSGAPPRRIILW